MFCRNRHRPIRLTRVAAAALILVVAALSVAIPITTTSVPSAHAQSGSVGICDRTPQVRDAIVAAIEGISDCANVTASHLAGITQLAIEGNDNLTTLKAGDFAGLTSLTHLNLKRNSITSSGLPAALFSGLDALTILELGFNSLGSVPSAKISSLSKLEELDLRQNGITTVPANAFSGLSELEELHLSFNEITTLDAGAFSGLSKLERLYLHVNRIAALPSRVFSGTPRLRTLGMTGNPMTTFPDGLFVGLTNLALLDTGGESQHVWFEPKLPISLAWVSDADGGFSVKLTAPAGAPFDILRVPVTVQHGHFLGRLEQIEMSILQGDAESTAYQVFGGGPQAPAAPTVTIGDLPVPPPLNFNQAVGHRGYVLVKSPDSPRQPPGGVCDRTRQVRDAIVAKVSNVNNCFFVTAEHLAAITELDLSVARPNDPAASMDALQTGDFAGLNRLTSLNLNGNNLGDGDLPAGVFSDLTNLTELNLGHHQFTTVPSDAISGLVTLQTLSMANGQLATVPANAFVALTALETLDLGGNDPLTTISNDAFAGLTALTRLDLSNSYQLGAVPSSALSGLSALEELLLSNTGLTAVPSGAFSGLSNLNTLHLNFNRIATLESGAFSGLTALELLALNGNQLTAVPTAAFSGLSNLSVLSLNANQITTLPDGVFVGLSILTFLDLSHNPRDNAVDLEVPVELVEVSALQFKITVPTGAPFTMSVPVTVSHGSIEGTGRNADTITVPIGATESAAFMVTASGTATPIVTMGTLPTPPPWADTGGHRGYRLLNWNDGICNRTPEVRDAILAQIDGISDCADVTATHLDGITRLEVAGSTNLTTLKAGDFAGLTALTHLFIVSHPQLTVFPTAAFSRLPSLQHMKLSGTGIATIPAGAFAGLPGLPNLDLSNNEIATLDPRAFSSLSNLTTLYLNANQLTALPDGLFAGLSNLETLDLSRNPKDNSADLEMPVELVEVSTNEFKVSVPTGAPFNMSVPANVSHGSVDGGATAFTVPTGATESATLTVTASGSGAPIVTMGNLPTPPGWASSLATGHQGYVLVKAGGICDRTPQVRDAIMAALAGTVNHCADVAAPHLAGITGKFDLSADPQVPEGRIFSLKAGDFAGLSGLTMLDLNYNALVRLPDGVFSDLTSLETLEMNLNGFTAVPTNAFAGLTSLTRLDLGLSGSLTAIPTNAFSGLSSLQTLNLGSHRQLATIEPNAFNGLSSLTELSLIGQSKLETLPSGVFNGLSSLERLYLSDTHSISTISWDAFSGLSELRSLNLANNRIAALDARTFNGLSELKSLSLADNEIATLDARTFNGLSKLGTLYLNNNLLTDLPDGVFTGLRSLVRLSLDGNPVDGNPVDLEVKVSLAQVDEDEFKVTVHTGATHDMQVPIIVTNGSIEGGATTVRVPTGKVESEAFRVVAMPGASGPLAIAFGDLPAPPSADPYLHTGYVQVISVKPGTPQLTRTRFAEPSAPALDVTWTAAAGTVITGYEARYRKQGDTAWTDQGVSLAASTTTLSLPNLQPGAVYEAQVRARTAGGFQDWSDTGRGRANRPPYGGVWFLANMNVNVGVWYRDWNTATRYFHDADGDTLTLFTSSDNSALVNSWVGNNGYTFNFVGSNPGRSTITYGVRDGYGGEVTRTVVYSAYANGVRKVPESPKGFYVGRPVPGNPTRYNAALSPYTLTGEAAATFDIDPGTAQVTLKPGHTLDFEAKRTYTGRVEYTANGGAATIGLTIEVQDIPAPDQPLPPIVTAVEGYADALNVAWTAPDSHGSPITDYNLRYRPRGGNSRWVAHPFEGANVSTILTVLSDANFEAQVQAVSGEGSSPWSDGGYVGAPAPTPAPTPNPDPDPDPDPDPETGPETPQVQGPRDGNTVPYFNGPEFRYVDESATAGTAAGSPVTAIDDDGDALTYSISGAPEFAIDADTGQIRVAAQAIFNRVTTSSYLVTVGVSDGRNASGNGDTTVDARAQVAIRITNAEHPHVEPSLAIAGPDSPIMTPDPFTVTATFSDEPGAYHLTTNNLNAPLNAATAGNVVNFTDIQPAYRESRWGTWPYQVQLSIAWRGVGETWEATYDPDPPRVHRIDGPAGPLRDTFTVGIQLTETPVGFTVDDLEVSGGVATALHRTGAWAYEADIRPTHNGSLTVDIRAGAFQDEVGHGNLAAEQYRVTVDLSPSRPGAPRMPQSPIDPTSMLDVIWAAPQSIDGLAVTGYAVQFRAAGAEQWHDHPHGNANTITTLANLAQGEPYQAQVRGENDYGVSDWSDPGEGFTLGGPGMIGTDGAAGQCANSDDGSADAAPRMQQYPNTSADMRDFPYLRVQGNLEFRLEFPVALPGSGAGGPYTYDIQKNNGPSLTNGWVLPGVSFDPDRRVLRGMLLTDGLTDRPMSPAHHTLEYVVTDQADGRCVIPFVLTASEMWSHVFIDPQYPWVAQGKDAVFVVRGTYAFNVPEVTLEITTTGDNGVPPRRDTVTIPVTATQAKDVMVEYAVPTTGVDAVTVALVPQDGYIVSNTEWLNSATVKVVEEVIRPDVTVTADGGSPYPEVSPGDTIVIRGSHRVDAPYPEGTTETTSYEWAQTSTQTGVTLSETGGRNLSVTIPAGRMYGELLDFTLTVKVSPEGATDADTGTATVRIAVASSTGESGSIGPGSGPPPEQQASVAPTADAGPDLTGAPGESVTLQGTNSINPYGESWELEHQWTQLSGPPATLSDVTVGDPAFTIPADAEDGATLEFQLTVTNTDGESDSDTTVVTVVEPVRPTACAGDDLTGAAGTEITLQGRCSVNPYGKWYHMEHRWTQRAGPSVTLSDPTRGDPSFTVPDDAEDGTTLEFQLTVTDQEGEADSDTMIVTVGAPEAVRPTACAGDDLTGAPGESVTLQGTCSTNPYGAWWRLIHSWSQVSGPAVTLDRPTHGDPTFTIPADAADGVTMVFQLTVTDQEGESDSATMVVTVAAEAQTRETLETNSPPAFNAVSGSSRNLSENSPAGVNIGAPFTATDPDDDALTYSRSGADADSFDINAATGQLLTREGVTYDYESKSSYALAVAASDGDGGRTEIAVTVNLTDVNDLPVFDEGDSASRRLAENGAARTGVGAPLTATDQDGDTLTYALSGDAADSFDLSAATGQLLTKEGITYDYEVKSSYSVVVEVSDGNAGNVSISVTVTLVDEEEPERGETANNAPVFGEGTHATREVPENSAAGTKVGALITATDADGDTLTYSLSGDDAGSFDLNPATGQLTTVAGVTYDHETQAAYSLVVTAADGNGGTASIPVTVNLTDVNEAPAFGEGSSTTRQVAENSAAGVNVGAAVVAIDPDGDTLTYTLSGSDAESFSIDAGTGQVQTKAGVSYDYETQASYSLVVTADDPNGGTASILVTVNLTDVEEDDPNQAPVFDEGDSATRTLAENTAGGENVGVPLTATDPDEDTLTYTLSGADVGSFNLNAATGQLTTREGATYDYEAKHTYAVTVTAEDPEGASASIAVTVNLTDVDETPPDTAPTVSDTSQLKNHEATVGQAFSVVLPAADEGSGNGGPYEYLLWHQGQGRNFMDQAINGLRFDTETRELSGTPEAAGVWQMSYVIHDADDNRSVEDRFREREKLRVTVSE